MLRRSLNSLLQAFRLIRLKFAGANVSHPRRLAAALDCHLGVAENGPGKIQIGPGAWLESGVVLHAFGGQILLGENIFLGPYTVIYGHGNVTIGNDCLISMHCRILSSNHAIPPMDQNIRWQPDELLPTRIGNDVWLGAGVTVLGGVDIGDGCVVGAGAVVTHDLPPGAIAYGVPARIQGYRPVGKLPS